ncbi:MAG: FAD-dependent oxidoreductase [Candidatus Zeuxoniibacter abyssi]|nr:MAG: FAD-dependent oxidoreductase [Candidatus Persebacteraceae bacterium AB1(2)]
MAENYKTVVIGRGLIGSAATRHLACIGEKVAVIGPAEPADKSLHQGVFGSHYDSGRITRILDPHPFYAAIAKKSIRRYRDLERQSGVSFYAEVGHLAVSDRPDYFCALKKRADENAVCVDILNAPMLMRRFPFFNFSAFGDGFTAIYQAKDGGYINPREQIRAQCAVILKSGGTVIEEEAKALKNKNGKIEVISACGRLVADKVLLATGAFANTGKLIFHKIKYSVVQHTVVTGEIAANRVRDFVAVPTLICKIGEDARRHFYFMPPVCYPDGKWRVKIGHTDDKTMPVESQALRAWFQGVGDPEKITFLNPACAPYCQRFRFAV